MSERESQSRAALVAELNDLLQLDHDAVGAYDMAIEKLESEAYREVLRGFRADHERHIEEVTELVEKHGGEPLDFAHLPTGVFKLAAQALGVVGGDREILLAFKANERQVRDKYRRHADRDHTPDVTEVLKRAAADEVRHYDWVAEELDRVGYGPETLVGQAGELIERIQGAEVDAIEAAGRRIMEEVEKRRR